MLWNAEVIDARLHEPALTPDWSVSDMALGRQVLAELQLVTMDAVGVGCAVLYPVDLDWAADVVAKHPHRLVVVAAFAQGGVLRGSTPAVGNSALDPLAPDVNDRIAALAAPARAGLGCA